MKRLVIAFVATVGITLLVAESAQAAGCGCRGQAGTAPATVYAPAQGTVVAQGQAGTSYRSYSYQPAPAYRYAPLMRGPSRTSAGFGDATRKALGNY